MVGKLIGDGWTAELSEDGKWSCADPLRQMILADQFRASEDSSPALGAFGRATLRRAAESLGVEVEYGPVPESVEGRIY